MCRGAIKTNYDAKIDMKYKEIVDLFEIKTEEELKDLELFEI